MIMITAPTGDIGHQVLANVLDSGQPIRVIVRDPSRLAAEVREKVDVVRGSHGDPEVLDRAFEGADSVFWLTPPDPQASSVESAYVDFTRPACAAFKRHGVQRVVGISALGRGTPWADRAGYVTASLAMDDLIASSGVSYRALVMPSFMENLLNQVDPIREQGMFFGPISADHKDPSCSTRDIAAAAAKLLLDDRWTGSDPLAVLGPEDLSFNDMAEIMSDVLDKPVRYQQIPWDAFKARVAGFGLSEAMTQAFYDMIWAKDQGLDRGEPRTSQSTSPTSFRQWCQEVLKPAVEAESAVQV